MRNNLHRDYSASATILQTSSTLLHFAPLLQASYDVIYTKKEKEDDGDYEAEFVFVYTVATHFLYIRGPVFVGHPQKLLNWRFKFRSQESLPRDYRVIIVHHK